MEDKRFDEWMNQKEKLHNIGRVPAIRDGEIWWCGCGENVGTEINGKNEMFSRPILVMKKLSRFGFMGVPLTSKKHDGSWYVEFEFLGKNEYAVVAQARYISVSRLYKKIGMAPRNDLEKVRSGFLELFSK